jgi:hypothetical protein
MKPLKIIILGVAMLTGVLGMAQETESQVEAQKVKDSAKMDVRHLSKVTTTVNTTTTRRGRRKKLRETNQEVKVAPGPFVARDTITPNDGKTPVTEVEKVKTE